MKETALESRPPSDCIKEAPTFSNITVVVVLPGGGGLTSKVNVVFGSKQVDGRMANGSCSRIPYKTTVVIIIIIDNNNNNNNTNGMISMHHRNRRSKGRREKIRGECSNANAEAEMVSLPGEQE
ncbi:hypothetical protein M0802_009981 [Mischocyttarus mexicanus]|nr:hypothetical protein M0802_009981 [Mischocyttarus mexicanus]